MSEIVAELFCSAMTRVAWKTPRLLKKELNDDETNLIPMINEMEKLVENVTEANQGLMALAHTRQTHDRDDGEKHAAGAKIYRTDRNVLI